jgi:predicted deacylase
VAVVAGFGNARDPEGGLAMGAAARSEIDIDLDLPGKRLGTIGLVHSDDRHAFSRIPVPIAAIVGGDGPGVMLSAGTHGDEYEGQAVMQALLREIEPADVAGRLYILPALNYPAVLAEARCSPLDGGNLNRVFPGDPRLGPTSALAAILAREVMPRVRYAMDLHSGGRSSRYTPCTYLHWGGDAAHRRSKLAGARAFGAPSVVVSAGTANPGSMTAECDRRGIVMVSTELGGGGTIDRRMLAIGREGVRRALAHWGILRGEHAPEAPTAMPRLLLLQGREGSPMAEADGVFEPTRELDDEVSPGDEAGLVYPVGEISRPALRARFATHGVVVSRRVPALVRRGDLLYNVASPVTEAELGLS